jgi:hypothetical protein
VSTERGGEHVGKLLRATAPARFSVACARSSVDRALASGAGSRWFESSRARWRIACKLAGFWLMCASGVLPTGDVGGLKLWAKVPPEKHRSPLFRRIGARISSCVTHAQRLLARSVLPPVLGFALTAANAFGQTQVVSNETSPIGNERSPVRTQHVMSLLCQTAQASGEDLERIPRHSVYSGRSEEQTSRQSPTASTWPAMTRAPTKTDEQSSSQVMLDPCLLP